MQYCKTCKKAIATIFVADLEGWGVVGEQHLCSACAEQAGVIPAKQPLKLDLQDLFGLTEGKPRRGGSKTEDHACPGCGMSLSDFKVRGRLGCPRCYEVFRDELMPLLQRIHESQTHTGRLPGTLAEAPAGPDEHELSDLRRRLEDAVRGERYEEAARLRDDLRRAERGELPHAEPGDLRHAEGGEDERND